MISEPGADVVARLWSSADVRTSTVLLCAEGRAVIAAAVRLRRMSPRQQPVADALLANLIDDLDLIDVDRELATTAGALASQHALRGYDAVHLASASTLRAADPIFVSWDRSLSRAARAEQLVTLPA